MAGFKVDFTAKDVEAKGARGFDPLPGGFYECDITDIEVVEVKNGDNKGKPMFKVELTISEGNFAKRKLWSNVMLYNVYNKEGEIDNWFLTQFLKATGNGDAVISGDVPGVESFDGKHVTASVRRVKDEHKNRIDSANGPHFKNTVNGFKFDDAEGGTAPTAAKRKNNLLP